MSEFLSTVNPYILLWLIMMVVFVVAELISVGLTSIWFAAGAFVALIAAILGGGLPLQIILFIAVSIILLSATRPWAKKFINSKLQKTNADSLIGQAIVVSEKVSNYEQTGRVIVQGQDWMARAANDDEIFEIGEHAEIADISGVKLILKKIKEDS